MARICVIDDKAMMRESVTLVLTRADHLVETFEDARSALPVVLEGRFDLVLTDLKMPRMDGLTLIRELRESGCDTPIIVMTAYGTVRTAVEAMKLGAFDYIEKPLEMDVIDAHVERALQHGRMCKENEALRRSLSDMHAHHAMIGDSKHMTDLRIKITRVAQSDAAVLITGESGTGKELVSHAVHTMSKRKDRPMLCLNCAALSGNLLESELFGHERGAFTGADRLRKGRFELADGGTLLLDEISEMGLSLQAKLLRVLQEGQFERVGSSVTRQSNVRIIATSNRNLESWVGKKRFRADLYYRLNVLPVKLAPLRERPEDVPILVHHFLDQISRRLGRLCLKVAAEALEILTGYAWPGNVRELQNLCERCAALVPDGNVTSEIIEGWIQGSVAPVETFSRLRPGRMLEDVERQLIERTLKQFNGHREKTAKTLGMGVRTLGMKLKQWREEAAAQTRTKLLREQIYVSQ
ncbi:MAG: sigma-54-dependent Fis family transcriptional regulator [Phycisphaerae bacterium]|nr:sigma-54-dependent Fis family transcriptional regulator [Phycisphaerae bacterium]